MGNEKVTKDPQKSFVDTKPALYIMAMLSGWTAELISYPFDVAKSRLQIQGEIANKLDYKLVTAPKRGIIGTVYGIITEEGFFKLYQGFSAMLTRHLVYSGTRVTIYRTLKEDFFMVPRQQPFPLHLALMSGIFAGACAQTLATPADVARIRLQMEGKRKLLGMEPRVKNLRHAFRDAWSQGGLRGLYKGCIPGIFRGACITTGDVATYDKMKRILLDNTSIPEGSRKVHILASLCSGFIGSVITAPADVVLTRTMHQRVDSTGKNLTYKHGFDVVFKSIFNEGVTSLYKGFIPLYIKCGPWSVIFWMTFEELQNIFGGKGW